MKTRTKRKRHSAAFKAKVGIEADIGVKTVAQIAREYSVHPVQVSQWKAVIRDRLPELFEAGGKAGEDSEKHARGIPRSWASGCGKRSSPSCSADGSRPRRGSGS